MGSFLNGYIINAGVIIAYILIYRRLRAYYIQVACNYEGYIRSEERAQMDSTLTSLRVFFGCICQFFANRMT